ncbi:O-antigen ligase family protein [Lactobacillus sp. PV034]|uniref:O-antigen ligase family protein n=1 Tax=Lactobacillus sp. PV034 TaxID=2594495 RepID=UPI00224057C8|nr:O-antigen ligase family protein [Lactobacillus sp. PV034]QNQ80524.1 hypothetical protein FP432_02635 [Lactobacillus sp. PV034]
MKIGRIYNFFNYIIAAILIYNCQSIWASGLNNEVLNTVTYFILVASALINIILLLTQSKNQVNLSSILIDSLFIIVYLGLFIFFSTYPNTKLFALRLLIVVVLFFWLIKLENKRIPSILISYWNLMIIIGLISLLFWVLGSLFRLISPTGTVESFWGAFDGIPHLVNSYFNVYYETQSVNSIIGTFIRNTAIFTEGPMAALNFSLALLIGINSSSKNLVLKNTILVFSLASTFTTTGYIFLTILILGHWIDRLKKKNSFNISYLIFILPILIVGSLLLIVLFNQKRIYGSGSVDVRFDDYRVGLKTWTQHIIFGTGISNSNALRNNMELWRMGNPGFSNSITEVLANGGLYLGILYFGSFFKGLLTKDGLKKIFVVMTFYLFVTTAFTYNYILIFLLIWFSSFSTTRENNNEIFSIEAINKE